MKTTSYVLCKVKANFGICKFYMLFFNYKTNPRYLFIT